MFTNVALPQVENSSALMTLLLQACRQDFGSSASCPIFYGSQELPVRQVSVGLAYNPAHRTVHCTSCAEELISLLAALPHLRRTFSPSSRSQRLHPESTLENRGAAVYITRGCRRILEAEDGICRLYHAAIRAIPTCSFEIKHTF
ncbi:uncharacterized protein LOC124417626 isoform X3 [Gallus gallus]|nr:uncharacterized protein LOC124417626 isoform X3 [Gallus gallus]